jgi:hypothetical protein
MTDDDKQAIRDMIRRFELLQDHIDLRFDERTREFDNLMRQQLTISAANAAALATLNSTLIQIGARLEAMAALQRAGSTD